METGLWQEYKDDGVFVYGINDEALPVLLNFLEQVEISFPVIRGTPGGYTLFGGLSPFPRDYIIDPDGIVQYAATEYRPTEMSTLIERLLPSVIRDDGNKVAGGDLPRGYILQQNYPNPFNPSTSIRFQIAEGLRGAEVDLSIYSLRGKRVRTLVSRRMGKGVHTFHWDGVDEAGLPVPSGAYFYRLKVGKEQSVRKMILTR